MCLLHVFHLQHSEPSDGNGLKPQKSKQIRSGYDPFKLVPCQPFTEDSPVSCWYQLIIFILKIESIHTDSILTVDLP